MKPERATTTIYVSKQGLQNMENLAQRFGYLQTRGAGAGKIGSISQLIEAIAREELTLQRDTASGDGLAPPSPAT
jgi:hypothetical protein